MFNLKTVRERLLKQWQRNDFHKGWLTDALVYPLQLSLSRITDRQLLHGFAELQAQVTAFRQQCAGLVGIELVEKEYNFFSMGRQRIPLAVEFASQDAVCRFIGQKTAWDNFCADVSLLRHAFPQLEGWLAENISVISCHHGDWPHLIRVCHYFLARPRPMLYLRQLDIPGIDSKFIETRRRVLKSLLDALLPAECLDLRYTQLANYGFEQRFGLQFEKPLIRFRLLDPALAAHFGGMTDMSVPVDEFARLNLPLSAVYVTENKVNFLAFPQVASALVIFGQGYGVQLLRQVTWLTRVKLYYWGDIDSNGFAILSQLRGYFSHVESLLMDEATVLASRAFWGEEPEKNVHPAELLPFLTESEQQVYQKIKSHCWQAFLRIEQERIPFPLLQRALPT